MERDPEHPSGYTDENAGDKVVEHTISQAFPMPENLLDYVGLWVAISPDGRVTASGENPAEFEGTEGYNLATDALLKVRKPGVRYFLGTRAVSSAVL